MGVLAKAQDKLFFYYNDGARVTVEVSGMGRLSVHCADLPWYGERP